MPLSGEPLTENLPSASSMSSGAASSWWATILLAPCRPPSRSRGRSTRRRRPASASRRCRGRTGRCRCRRADVDLVGRDAQPVGDDLGERGVEPLAVRRGAGVDGHAARRVHAHDRGLVEARLQADAARADHARGREAADLHPGGEADAAVLALASQLLLLGAERVDVDVLEQLVERAVVVAGVVDDADRHLGREVLLRDEVLPPQLERVHAQLRRRAARSSPRSGGSPRAGRRRGWRRWPSCW